MVGPDENCQFQRGQMDTRTTLVWFDYFCKVVGSKKLSGGRQPNRWTLQRNFKSHCGYKCSHCDKEKRWQEREEDNTWRGIVTISWAVLVTMSEWKWEDVQRPMYEIPSERSFPKGQFFSGWKPANLKNLSDWFQKITSGLLTYIQGPLALVRGNWWLSVASNNAAKLSRIIVARCRACQNIFQFLVNIDFASSSLPIDMLVTPRRLLLKSVIGCSHPWLISYQETTTRDRRLG